MRNKPAKAKIVERKYLIPFIIVTSLFALWGFVNDITNPMVAAFKTVLEISNAKASLVQFAFYGGYFTMAIPSAIFVQKYSYKKGILIGLALLSTGALLFWKAANAEHFTYFLIAYYILTFGLAFLETTSNPYILAMGSKKTATRRLNLAQSFNPIGSLLGMIVASRVVLAALESDARTASGELIFPSLDKATRAAIRTSDLLIIRNPYVILGLIVLMMFVIILVYKMPSFIKEDTPKFSLSLGRLLKNKTYCGGVVAQIFYVGAQIMCWTFIIQYAERLGLSKSSAQNYNIVAMTLFLSGRFLCTYLMRFINARKLLTIFAIGGMITISGTIFFTNMWGLYCLLATSAFMSLMFPTIYGIALEDVGYDATLGAAGLVMAIVGGALMPPVQATIIDMKTIGSMPAENISFILPFICFCVIARYGYVTKQYVNDMVAR